MYSHKQRMFIL